MRFFKRLRAMAELSKNFVSLAANRSPRHPIAVTAIPGKGRGVIACRNFAEGEVIERCPVIVLSEVETAPGMLANYTFTWCGGRQAIVLGYGSLYNHSANPNADFLRFCSLHEIRFVAVRDILIGEEITFDYGWDKNEMAGFSE